MSDRGGARVVVDVPLFHLDRAFTYRVPERLRGSVWLGSRVKVPFGSRRRVDGWVVGWTDELPEDTRDLERVVSPVPAFDADGLVLLRWVADRYAGTLSDVLRLAVPPRVAAVERDAAADPAPPADPAVADPAVADPAAPAAPGAVMAPASPRAVTAPRAPATGPGTGGDGDPDRLVEVVGRGWAGAAYWRPLPGEDRSARVIALIEAALARGRGAIVVTPEVAAGSVVADAVRKHFPDAADLSSDLSERRRYRSWVELRLGRRQVAIGGRSAVLAPVRRLGCIVIDDEANPAHKEQRTPRYHAREVALRRADRACAVCVLTGTVPSPEVIAAIQAGQCRLVAADRALERRLRPLVEVVDPYEQDHGPGPAKLHRHALAAIRAAVARGESAYVLVPRRGAADPSSPGARTAGQVTDDLGRFLGTTPVWRLDREVLDPGEVPPWAGQGPGVIVGTVAGVKDHPPLTGCRTVVVVGADAALSQAEVRSTEEAYRTWSRAAAWCGPRERPGRVLVQTSDPGHHAVQALVRWDPAYFWRHELPHRIELGFPPARRLLLFEGAEPGEAAAASALVAGALGPKAELLGPAAMGRGWRIIAKVEDAEAAARALRPALAEASRSGGPRMSVDVEPLEVLAAPRPP
jgi:primosomal protein N' (replication factor Y) (superfamily II helicase)